MKKYIFILTAALLAVGCSKQDGLYEPEELGVVEKTLEVDCVAGECVLHVKSDGDFTAYLPDDCDWLSFKGSSSKSFSGSGDTEIAFSYIINRGLSRSAVVSFERGRRKVSVTLTQRGVLSSDIEFSSHSIAISSDASEQNAKILSIYKDEELDVQVVYEGEVQNWISDVVKENNFIRFNVLSNDLPDTRSAWVTVTSKANPEIGDRLQVIQLGNEVVVEDVSFQQVRDLLSEPSSITIENDYVITGWNIGDNLEGNGGENINVSASVQDLTVTERTIYLESPDGKSGFRIIFDSAADNILSRYEKVSIYLKGLTLTRKGGTSYADPLRYELTNAKASNIFQTQEGSYYDIPEKIKTISQLTENDIYTLVTLKDCEIPIRKGPFMPIDLRHTFIIHSYPMVLRDKNGDNTHIMTNTTAAWQRDGNGLPQGSGNVTGVIVHETCDNFEWDNEKAAEMEAQGIMTDYVTGIGNIGRFQIRPFSRGEIALEKDFKNGFSEMIMEIRYFSSSSADPIIQNVSTNGTYAVMYPTYPAVEDPLLDPSVNGRFKVLSYNDSDDAATATEGLFKVFRDWTHLGPMSGAEITDPERGNGVEDLHGVKSEWAPYSTVSSTALIMKSSAWYGSNGWGEKKAWTVSFSTENLTAANAPLSVQFGCCNGLGQTVGAPRYWNVEYSVDGVNWNYAGGYTCPDFPILSNRKPWQCPCYKYVSVTLPDDTELFGKTEVFVRLRPSSAQAGQPNTYDGGTITSGRETELNYFAIRYNK